MRHVFQFRLLIFEINALKPFFHVTEMFRSKQEVKMLRVYGRSIESQNFLQMGVLFTTAQQAAMDKSLEDIALHYRIRRAHNPHSRTLLQLEREITDLKKYQVRLIFEHCFL